MLLLFRGRGKLRIYNNISWTGGVEDTWRGASEGGASFVYAFDGDSARGDEMEHRPRPGRQVRWEYCFVMHRNLLRRVFIFLDLLREIWETEVRSRGRFFLQFVRRTADITKMFLWCFRVQNQIKILTCCTESKVLWKTMDLLNEISIQGFSNKLWSG